ncbi:14027_t:CDS:2, partial [Funneliformis geosporum]
MVVFTYTNALAKDFQNDRKVKAQTWHNFFRWNGVGEWTPERMGEKKFPRVVIWDKVICCGDDAQPPPFFGEMPHSWLKERADYYEEVLTDYRAKCPRLQELKKRMRRQNNRMQSDLFREALLVTEKWEYLEAEWKPSDQKYPNAPIPLIYRPRDECKQNCLVQIPGSSEKNELVKNDIIHLPLNTLPDKFLKDMLADKKVIDWELGYAMTIHTTVGRVEYLSQLIRVETPPLPPEIAQEIEEAKKKRRLEHELRPSIQEKLIGYMGQDKEKGCEFDLTVDYILTLKRIQEDRYVLCLIEMKFEWDRPGDISQWTVDRIHN